MEFFQWISYAFFCHFHQVKIFIVDVLVITLSNQILEWVGNHFNLVHGKMSETNQTPNKVVSALANQN